MNDVVELGVARRRWRNLIVERGIFQGDDARFHGALEAPCEDSGIVFETGCKPDSREDGAMKVYPHSSSEHTESKDVQQILQDIQQVEEITMAENESGAGGFGWFLAGLGIGALIGVLYAPKSGKETREDLVSGALEAKEKAAILAQRGAETASQYVAQGKQAVGQYVEQGKQVAGEYADKGREYYEKGRTQWTEYVEKGKNLVNEQQEKVTAAIDAGKDAYVHTTTQG
jgi:gas vesicle protein